MRQTGESLGVIFDVDGVLVDSAESHYQSWRALGEEHGVRVTRDEFQQSFGRRNADIVPRFFGPVPPERLKALSDRKEEIYRGLIRAAPRLFPGAVELIEALAKAGVRLAIGSSGPRANLDLILSVMGVQDKIAVVVSGDDVTRGKPDPEVFTTAIGLLGLPASRCVVIEDAPAGIQAARAAGAFAVAVLSTHPAEEFSRLEVSSQPQLLVRRLIELNFNTIATLCGAAV
jgi:beta-phosphoglucomutase